MKLFLCSSFITEKTLKNFETVLGRPMAGSRIACIVTAAKGIAKGSDLSFIDNGLKLARETFGANVDVFDIEMMQPEEFSKFLGYDAIWFQGGKTAYLIKALRKTGFDKALPEILKKVVYIGSSAGSKVCSKVLDSSDWYSGEPEPGPAETPGLGLIDFQFYPHFLEENLEEILAVRHLDKEYWLLQDGHALAINDGAVRICGGQVIVLEKQA